ncbi:hypothetical protein JIN84_16105 [Luteolibacter yonseiensis]|uniref:Uncharacterized protein n=1 Tax=Luteolibacter yonseiensis TaxID=1144680 RepID=A0A934R8R0_9BACT|nr:hypothetical protein [Luteolibacter yonseiensis]MBK1817144.1 hypothetical protein [Luteolibacter yonseiensis]
MPRNLISAVWDRWANTHAFLRFLVVIAVLGITGLLIVKPAYRLFKGWRLEQNLETAQVAVQENRMDKARDLSLAVLRAGESRIEALRILEKATAGLGDPQHGEVSIALVSHPKGTDEDRFNGFNGLAATSPLGLVGQAWVGFSPDLRQQPRFAVLFAERLIQEKHFNEAAGVLLQVPEQSRNAGVEQNLIRILIARGDKQGYDEAQKRLAARFPQSGGESDGWLDLLEEIPIDHLERAALEPVRSILASPSLLKNARASLAMARLDYAAAGADRTGVIEKAVGLWKSEDPLALAGFLSKLGLHQKLLDSIPVSALEAKPALFAPLLEAMLRTGAWPEMAVLLDAPGVSLPNFEKLAYLAVIATKTGDASDKLEKWQTAILEAKYSQTLNPYLLLRKIALDADIPDIAEQMLVEGIRVGRGPLPLYKDLMPLLNSLAEQRKENTLMEICSVYLTFEPSNPVIVTQYSYFACLNNLAAPKTLLTVLEPIAKAVPKEIPVQCVLATVYLCDDQLGKATALLDSLELKPEQLAPGYRAVYLTVQVLNGRLSKKDPSITEFPWDSLQASERRKFSELIEAAPSTDAPEP